MTNCLFCSAQVTVDRSKLWTTYILAYTLKTAFSQSSTASHTPAYPLSCPWITLCTHMRSAKNLDVIINWIVVISSGSSIGYTWLANATYQTPVRVIGNQYLKFRMGPNTYNHHASSHGTWKRNRINSMYCGLRNKSLFEQIGSLLIWNPPEDLV